MRRILDHPLSPLCAFALISSLCFVTYLAAGLAVSARMQWLAINVSAILLLLWILADANRHRRVPCYDFGFFCALFFPFSIPWYCVWSRGWHGLLMCGLLICLWLGPHIVAGIVWQILYGRV